MGRPGAAPAAPVPTSLKKQFEAEEKEKRKLERQRKREEKAEEIEVLRVTSQARDMPEVSHFGRQVK